MKDGRLLLTGIWFMTFGLSACGYALANLWGVGAVFAAIGLSVVSVAAWRLWGDDE